MFKCPPTKSAHRQQCVIRTTSVATNWSTFCASLRREVFKVGDCWSLTGPFRNRRASARNLLRRNLTQTITGVTAQKSERAAAVTSGAGSARAHGCCRMGNANFLAVATPVTASSSSTEWFTGALSGRNPRLKPAWVCIFVCVCEVRGDKCTAHRWINYNCFE